MNLEIEYEEIKTFLLMILHIIYENKVNNKNEV